MEWLIYVSYFFGGAFFANSIPHLVMGVCGSPFQSPFAKPPGKGLSSSTVNVVWGFANLVAAYLLVLHVGPFEVRNFYEMVAVGTGVLIMSLMLAHTFGKLHGGDI